MPEWVDLPMLVAAFLTAAFYVIVFQKVPAGSMIHRYTTEHIVEYVVVAFFIWGIVDVVFKVCGFPLELMALRQPSLRERSGKAPGPEASMLKIRGTEIQQAITELLMQAVGPFSQPFTPEALSDGWKGEAVGPDYAAPLAARYFNYRKTSIYGGSNEIQKNIIAKIA